MDNKNIIKTIKGLFEKQEVVENENFADYKTEDGKILRAENLEVETEVKEITEEGEIALEDGSYSITELNLVIEVKGSKIVTVEEVAEEEVKEELVEEEVEEKKEEEVEVELKDISDESLQVGDKVSKDGEPLKEGEHELEDGRILVVDADSVILEVKGNVEEEMSEINLLESLIKELNEMKEDFTSLKNENKLLTEKFEKFSNEPSDESVVTKVDFSIMEKEDKLKFFSKK